MGYCDYRPDDRTVPDRVRCGSDLRQGALAYSCERALWGGVSPRSRKAKMHGEADVSAAKAIKPNVAEEFARYGL